MIYQAIRQRDSFPSSYMPKKKNKNYCTCKDKNRQFQHIDGVECCFKCKKPVREEVPHDEE